MRSRAALIAGALGAAGMALRALRRRPTPEAAGDPRAKELRRKLDESKPLVAEREQFESGETRVDEAEPSLDEKRASVHEQGRAAAREMRRANEEA
ncbi:MAG TPA: hypothetical protein VF002_08190 [Gaiellaceae bacterium]